LAYVALAMAEAAAVMSAILETKTAENQRIAETALAMLAMADTQPDGCLQGK